MLRVSGIDPFLNNSSTLTIILEDQGGLIKGNGEGVECEVERQFSIARNTVHICQVRLSDD